MLIDHSAYLCFCRLLTVALVAMPIASGQTYTISTVAGNGTGGFSGDGGPATSAQLSLPRSVAVDLNGNLYIADTANCRIRKVSADRTISTVAGSGSCDILPGDGDNPAISATLSPNAVAVDGSGNLLIADLYRIRRVTSDGIITTVACRFFTTQSGVGDGGPAISASCGQIRGMAVDNTGNIYFAEASRSRIRKVSTSGTISTVAGTSDGFSGDGGPALRAQISDPQGVAVDALGNLYIADNANNRIRKVSTDGIITTIAGGGSQLGDGGPATNARLQTPYHLTLDGVGNLFFSESASGNRVRKVTPTGTITTIGGTGVGGYSGDGGPATSAQFDAPRGISVDQSGNVYVGDYSNSRVRKLTPTGPQQPSIRPDGVTSASGFGQFRAISPATWIEIYGSNLGSTSRSWAGSDFSGSSAPTDLDGTRVTIGGRPAFIAYLSPGQVNAQVPTEIGTGSQPVVITTPAGASASFPITVNSTQPGLLAPSSFELAGKRYVAALFSDGSTFVLAPGAIAGVPSRRARPGDVITFYGIGFGEVRPSVVGGQIAPPGTSLVGNVQFHFSQIAGAVQYAGLSTGSVGLYQFNVVVPNVPPDDVTPLTFSLDGVSGPQKLYVAVGN